AVHENLLFLNVLFTAGTVVMVTSIVMELWRCPPPKDVSKFQTAIEMVFLWFMLPVLGFILGEIKIGGFGTELSGWLELVGVEPDNMGSGVGASLVEALFGALRERGVQEIYTAVRWDSGDMLAFFKKLGFDQSAFINLRLKT
ncbi:MAG: GNAT family N-acetyltransferase, partial [Proteobacteria bacterium]|nr:GNAT family N-acetyltransferase [Pseudomonadota bacterium]